MSRGPGMQELFSDSLGEKQDALGYADNKRAAEFKQPSARFAFQQA